MKAIHDEPEVIQPELEVIQDVIKEPTPEPVLELHENPEEQPQDEPQSSTIEQPEEVPQPQADSTVPPHFPSHRQFRPQKFQPRNNWNNGMPRWPQGGQFSGQRPPLRGPPMMGRPQMRPFPPQHQPFFGRPPQQRFFFNNQGRPPAPNYVPSPIQSGPAPMGVASMPRKVLINPNFKGGVEAAKSKLIN